MVGLGKTYIATLLAGQIEGRTLVIAPPVLIDETNPGSWKTAFSDFRIHADFKSIGKLDDLINSDTDKYSNIIIDESHRFRTESTVTYEKLAQICRGKKVILVTATPYNNSPKDILSQIKLFQKSKKSTIPNMADIESFFNGLDKKLKNLDRQKDYEAYIKTIKENTKEIREKVLKYLMVRRTRTEIEKYFSKDLKEQNVKFPDVEKPNPLFYQLNNEEDKIFNRTVELISKDFNYARYTPLLYYKEVKQPEIVSQMNMGKFMKILLVKRLESSFFAFKNSIDRFIHSYEMFIKEYKNGNVYVSKKYTNKIFELLENDDYDAIQRLIDEDKAEKYKSVYFKDEFLIYLENDLKILKEIKNIWQKIERDPKLDLFLETLKSDKILQKNKLVIFTESKETAEYLAKKLNEKSPETVLCFTGASEYSVRNKTISNFDAKSLNPKDDYRILVATEILSEGVNLHRSNVVINYDIPWNPTRMMQRVGRINRIDTKFDKIYTYNFFPTKQSNDQIKLKEAAEAKINAFLTLLGGDAAILTEGEPVGSHELFNRLISKQTLTGEDDSSESELKYLKIIKETRDNEPKLFEKIKRLPRKARTAKANEKFSSNLITYFRIGKLQKFYMADHLNPSAELDFMSAAGLIESDVNEKKQNIPKNIYELLDKNKNAFIFATTQENTEPQAGRGRDSSANIIKILKLTLKDSMKLTDDQESYIKKVITQLTEGGLPKQTAKETLKILSSLGNEMPNPFKVLAVLQKNIPEGLLNPHYAENNPLLSGKREVILSVYSV